MSGLVKAKKYDWKDSNLALFGSDTEKHVKKASAETEPAWKMAGKKPGLQIWRINKFKVETWPTDQYGSFYQGDSYIILNTYKDEDSDKLLYDVHFWIGKESTQDEYGTAAYKTVELDTLLDDVPVQHREVQAYESTMFKSYFKNIAYWKGGADTGFRHVTAEKFKPRLLQITARSKQQAQAKEVAVKRSRVTSDDVFILATGDKLYQFNGKTCNKDEKYKACGVMQELMSQRPKCEQIIVDEEENDETLREFWEAVDAADQLVDDDDDDDVPDNNNDVRKESKLVRLSDNGGNLQFSDVKSGEISIKDFKPQDVFLLHTSKELFVWVGNKTSENEKSNGIPYAHKYLSGTSTPFLPVTCLKQGQESKAFKTAIAA